MGGRGPESCKAEVEWNRTINRWPASSPTKRRFPIHLAEDAVQTAAKELLSANQPRDEALVMTVATRRLIDMLRKRAREVPLDTTGATELPAPFSGDVDGSLMTALKAFQQEDPEAAFLLYQHLIEGIPLRALFAHGNPNIARTVVDKAKRRLLAIARSLGLVPEYCS